MSSILSNLPATTDLFLSKCNVVPTSSPEYCEIIARFKSLRNPKVLSGMARLAINTENAFGISIPTLRKIAKEYRTNHGLALELWKSGIHEALILASMIDDPQKVTNSQMEKWVRGFNSWDVCDQCCGNLFDKTALAFAKAVEWSNDEREFVKRAGFVLMATLSVHRKEIPDSRFEKFFPIIKAQSDDNRNFVRKAVNWALRQIGKRSSGLRQKAVSTARIIQKRDSAAARWIAADALRELV